MLKKKNEPLLLIYQKLENNKKLLHNNQKL